MWFFIFIYSGYNLQRIAIVINLIRFRLHSSSLVNTNTNNNDEELWGQLVETFVANVASVSTLI
jgi:hypothetical protein